MTWQAQASCLGIDTEMFFHSDERGGNQGMEFSLVYRTCYDCRVKLECRVSGLSEDYGIFGNTSPRERMAMRSLMLKHKADVHGDLDRVRAWAGQVLDRVNAGRSMVEVLLEDGISRHAIKALFADSTGDRRARQQLAQQAQIKARRIA